MFCIHCGKEIADDSRFCPNCGKKLISEEKKKHTDDEKGFYYKKGDLAYATCTGITDTVYFFTAIDDEQRTFICPISKAGIEIDKGDSHWFHIVDITDDGKTKAKIITNSAQYPLKKELIIFSEQYKKGDIVKAPITDITDSYVEVALGFSARVRISVSLYQESHYASLQVDDIGSFTITKLSQDDNGRVTVALTQNVTYPKEVLKDWQQLPDTMTKNEVNVNGGIFDYLDDGVEEKLSKSGKNIEELLSAVDKAYRKEKKEKRISLSRKWRDGSGTLHAEFELSIKDNRGVPQAAYLKKDEGRKWYLSGIGPTNASLLIDRYVFIPDYKQMLSELDAICLPGENWEYGNSQNDEKTILKQYLKFTFYKCWLDDKIYEENGNAVFNTGLVDGSYDDIYCVLEKNEEKIDFYQRKWKYGYFASWGKGEKGKTLNREFGLKPAAPEYINISKVSELYYDTNKDLSCDYMHIIEDNIGRFPFEFIKNRLIHDNEAAALLLKCEKSQSQAAKRELYDVILRNDETGIRLRRNLEAGLKEAVETAKKYCRWNYKTAIPVYYAKSNSISLLLPLKLQTSSSTPADIALVIERLKNGNYQGQTVLTLEMAYQDARQICRPNSDWLTSESIKEKNNGKKDDGAGGE